MDGASTAWSNGRTGEALVFEFLGVFLLQRQNFVSSLKGKPSQQSVNFAAYGQVLKCKIVFHKEMSWCSA